MAGPFIRPVVKKGLLLAVLTPTELAKVSHGVAWFLEHLFTSFSAGFGAKAAGKKAFAAGGAKGAAGFKKGGFKKAGGGKVADFAQMPLE